MTSHYPEFTVYKISKHCGMIFYFLMAILALQNRRESSKPPRKLKTAGFIREGIFPNYQEYSSLKNSPLFCLHITNVNYFIESRKDERNRDEYSW